MPLNKESAAMLESQTNPLGLSSVHMQTFSFASVENMDYQLISPNSVMDINAKSISHHNRGLKRE